MPRWTIALFALSLAVAVPAAAQAMPAQGQMKKMEPPPSKEVTITGTVIDVSCKFGQGLGGEEHKMCSQICADRGLPLAILGSDGQLYIPASAGMPGDAQNERLKEFAEQQVTVKGKVFKAAGAQAIQIASITKKA
jgi:hypothetical protein